jgi:hypothetical protein
MVQGWRPTSVVVQPASTATKPSGATHWQSLRNQAVSNSRPRHQTTQPAATTPSMRKPIPTMMRKAKNTGQTGGR